MIDPSRQPQWSDDVKAAVTKMVDCVDSGVSSQDQGK